MRLVSLQRNILITLNKSKKFKGSFKKENMGIEEKVVSHRCSGREPKHKTQQNRREQSYLRCQEHSHIAWNIYHNQLFKKPLSSLEWQRWSSKEIRADEGRGSQGHGEVNFLKTNSLEWLVRGMVSSQREITWLSDKRQVTISDKSPESCNSKNAMKIHDKNVDLRQLP